MHPFAFGPTGQNPEYGDMHNPWNPELIAGGSSGGSGSAAAAGQCTLTMGTDTGGSIRIPSALCGLAGLKPTYGRLSRHGLTPLSWSLDHPGPMTRTVEDCALVMDALAGYDSNDPASTREPVPDFASSSTWRDLDVIVNMTRDQARSECLVAPAPGARRAKDGHRPISPQSQSNRHSDSRKTLHEIHASRRPFPPAGGLWLQLSEIEPCAATFAEAPTSLREERLRNPSGWHDGRQSAHCLVIGATPRPLHSSGPESIPT
jgi:Asp-tRNA(Asn)/Glu-tRNA(Gln) amidotransferase A subunit family amidase